MTKVEIEKTAIMSASAARNTPALMSVMKAHQKRDGGKEAQDTEQHRATGPGKQGRPGQRAGVMEKVGSETKYGRADGRDADPSSLS